VSGKFQSRRFTPGGETPIPVDRWFGGWDVLRRERLIKTFAPARNRTSSGRFIFDPDQASASDVILYFYEGCWLDSVCSLVSVEAL
jgi:hypothetical protein